MSTKLRLPLTSHVALANHFKTKTDIANTNSVPVQSRVSLANYFAQRQGVQKSPQKTKQKNQWQIALSKENRNLLANIEEIFIAGGGGAGRSLPAALREASRYGLDLTNKIKVACGTSVGTIACLGIVLGIPPKEMRQMLDDMPTDRFQDWSLRSIFGFFRNWGLCRGQVMPDYFKELIKDRTGLDDPTFKELYRAGYTKELRIIVSNASRQSIAILSHRLTPNMKVAQALGIACGIPLLYPPSWLVTRNNQQEAFTDGGIIKNYPFGIGSKNTPIEKQLGFVFVNKGAAYSIHNLRQNFLATIWGYIRNLVTMLVFQDPLCLPNNIKERTVAIAVNHNPFKFTATAQEQRRLDIAGQEGVRRMLCKWVKRKQKKEGLALTHQYEAKRHHKAPSPAPEHIPTRKARLRYA